MIGTEYNINNNNYNNIKDDQKCRNIQDNNNIFDHYEDCISLPRDELSSLMLSQFLNRLLSTLMWTHLITHLDLLHHVVEATKSPLLYGDLSQHTKVNNVPLKTNNNNNTLTYEPDGDHEEKLIYYDCGVSSIIIRMENRKIFRKIKSIFL